MAQRSFGHVTVTTAGTPVRVTVGERGLKGGVLEIKMRGTGEHRDVAVEEAVAEVVRIVEEARA